MFIRNIRTPCFKVLHDYEKLLKCTWLNRDEDCIIEQLVLPPAVMLEKYKCLVFSITANNFDYISVHDHTGYKYILSDDEGKLSKPMPFVIQTNKAYIRLDIQAHKRRCGLFKLFKAQTQIRRIIIRNPIYELAKNQPISPIIAGKEEEKPPAAEEGTDGLP